MYYTLRNPRTGYYELINQVTHSVHSAWNNRLDALLTCRDLNNHVKRLTANKVSNKALYALKLVVSQ